MRMVPRAGIELWAAASMNARGCEVLKIKYQQKYQQMLWTGSGTLGSPELARIQRERV